MTPAAGLRVLVAAMREPWPLNSGGRLHLHHVLRTLATQADVTLLLPGHPHFPDRIPTGVRCFSTGSAVPPAAPARRRPCDPLDWAERHFGPRPALAEWLARHGRRYDAILLNGAVLGQLIRWCPRPVIWNPQDELVLATWRDLENGGWRARLAGLRRAALYAAYERAVAQRAAATVFVSRVDAAWARRWCGDARLAVIANGVDHDYFRPADRPPRPGTVAFIGSLEFPPNIDAVTRFVADVWPALHAADSGRRLLIVGRSPVPAVDALAAVPGVAVHADVPDVRPFLAEAAVVVVPTRKGGGLKNKILEACAVGRPVVASPRALGGLTARPGRELLVADSARDWQAKVARLLDHPEFAAALGAGGRAWVRAAHSWERTGAQFYALLAAAAARHPRRGSSGAGPAAHTSTRATHYARLRLRPASAAPLTVAEELACR